MVYHNHFHSVLLATMGVQGKTFSCLWASVLLVRKQNHFYYSPHCTSMLHPPDLGTINLSVQKAPSTEDMCLKELGNEVELKINVLQVIHFIVAIWQQVMLSNIGQFFHQCN